MRRQAVVGFTLLEVSVALAILGVGILTCLRLFSGSLRLQDRASRETRVVLHARAAMDALLREPEIRNRSSSCSTTAEGFRACIQVRDAGAEEGVDAKALDFQSDWGLRYLEVDVTWQDGRGFKTYTLKSLRMAPASEE